jgi:hypothetical protein
MSSQAQIAANRANSEPSSGPKTETRNFARGYRELALCQTQAENREQEEQLKLLAKTAPEKIIPASAVALFNEAKTAAAANPKLNISEIGFDFANSFAPKKEAA